MQSNLLIGALRLSASMYAQYTPAHGPNPPDRGLPSETEHELS